jgi:branched-chain amino acid transport system substrate-binding protein
MFPTCSRVFLLLLVIVASGCDRPGTIELNGREVLIGFVGPISSKHSPATRDGLAGLKDVLAKKSPLPDGTSIKIIEIDSENNESVDSAVMDKLAGINNLLAVVSFNDSESVLSFSQHSEQLKLPVIAALATHPAVTNNLVYMNQLLFDDQFQGRVAAMYVRDERLVDRVAIISDSRRIYSQHLADEFLGSFLLVSGEVTSNISVDSDNLSAKKLISTIEAEQPELLYLTLSARQVLQLLEALDKIDWQPDIMVPDGVLANLFRLHPGKLALYEGLLSTDVYTPDLPLPDTFDKYGWSSEELNAFTVIGIEAGLLIENALLHCLPISLDRECMQGALRKGDYIRGLVGMISMGKDGKTDRPIVISRVVGGKSKFLVRVN